MHSILQTRKESYLSKSETELERHHIFFGSANRRLSEKYGLWVYLTAEEHRGRLGVHNDRDLDLYLKRSAQKKFELSNTRETFRKIFCKSYL